MVYITIERNNSNFVAQAIASGFTQGCAMVEGMFRRDGVKFTYTEDDNYRYYSISDFNGKSGMNVITGASVAKVSS